MKPTVGWLMMCAVAGWIASTGVGEDARGPNKSLAMEPRISVVTLGVSDLDRSFKFYRDAETNRTSSPSAREGLQRDESAAGSRR